MSDLGRGLGNAVGALILAVTVMAVVFVPLGLWKLIEIAIWLWRNINISWGSP